MNRADRRRAAKAHEHKFTPSPSNIKPDGTPDLGGVECDVCGIRLEDAPKGQTLTYVAGYSPGLVDLNDIYVPGHCFYCAVDMDATAEELAEMERNESVMVCDACHQKLPQEVRDTEIGWAE